MPTISRPGMEFKQVIVVRADLKMSVGKLSSQVGHAAVSAAEECRKKENDWYKSWLDEGQRKVVLKAESLDELLGLKAELDKVDIPNVLITDKGLTELPPDTVTALGIGPAPEQVVDKITGRLLLL